MNLLVVGRTGLCSQGDGPASPEPTAGTNEDPCHAG